MIIELIIDYVKISLRIIKVKIGLSYLKMGSIHIFYTLKGLHNGVASKVVDGSVDPTWYIKYNRNIFYLKKIEVQSSS